jgi:hypothetical protein
MGISCTVRYCQPGCPAPAPEVDERLDSLKYIDLTLLFDITVPILLGRRQSDDEQYVANAAPTTLVSVRPRATQT